MFDRLSDSFSSAFRNLSGRGKITESNVREAMEDVRRALLEADVEYSIANEFCEEIISEALGREVTKSLKPGEEMVGIVHQALVELMSQGSDDQPGLPRISPSPTIVMMCGLQGSGKTTTCGKLAAYLKKRGRSVMIAAADLQRPAAVEQLATVAQQVETDFPGGSQVHFYSEPDKCAAYGKAVGVAVKVCQNALKAAQKQGVDTLILDTAGRLHVNDDLMGELSGINTALRPHQILLVTDAMTGQDAVQSAKAFNERLEIDGVVLTKFDSDTRGGAALTVKKITGAPIKFIGTGERLDALEEFHAERIAQRILGMGDVVSLVEKAQEQVSEEEAEALAAKMAKGEFTMDDLVKQMRQIRKMGPMKQLLGMMPGVGSALKNIDIDEKQLDRVEGIVNSMTKAERDDAKLINHSRRKRIAAGAGVKVQEVGQLIKQFDAMSKLTKQMAGMGLKGKMGAMRQMQAAGGMPGVGGMPDMGGMPGFARRQSTKTSSPKKRFKQKKRR